MNKSLLDTDIYSEVIKAINPTVPRDADYYYKPYPFLIGGTTLQERVIKFDPKQRKAIAVEASLVYNGKIAIAYLAVDTGGV